MKQRCVTGAAWRLLAWQSFHLAQGECGLCLGLFYHHKAQHNNILINSACRDSHIHTAVCQLQNTMAHPPLVWLEVKMTLYSLYILCIYYVFYIYV